MAVDATVGGAETPATADPFEPAPFTPPGLDLRDLPIPREAFAQMAVMQFGISIEEARAHANRIADAMEGRRTRRRRA